MNLIKLKLILIIAALIIPNYASASIATAKKTRASVEVDASQAIDNSYITPLDENSMFEKVTGAYNDELDFIDELDLESELRRNADNSDIKRNISSSSDIENLNDELPN